MIKINLLESVTDKQVSPIVTVEKKVGSPSSRLLVMTLAVVGLLLLISVGHYVNAQMNKAEAERQLAEQKRIAAELEAVMKEQKELEQKIANIDARIEAIKRLRASQAGPSAVLEAVRERIAMVPGLYLESIEQKGEQLTIKGNSPDEAAVTQFGRSLEFSSGLFTNLNIETQRKEITGTQISNPAPGANPAEAPKLETVNFTIRTAYTPGKSGSDQQNQTQTAANGGGGATATPNAGPIPPGGQNPPQVAQNQDK
jgi:Tfp pilus assembly protein PilN